MFNESSSNNVKCLKGVMGTPSLAVQEIVNSHTKYSERLGTKIKVLSKK